MKHCANRPGHKLSLTYVEGDEVVAALRYVHNSKTVIFFDFSYQTISINKYDSIKMYYGDKIFKRLSKLEDGATHIPWFEPDFSNFSKLLRKINTYTIFS